MGALSPDHQNAIGLAWDSIWALACLSIVDIASVSPWILRVSQAWRCAVWVLMWAVDAMDQSWTMGFVSGIGPATTTGNGPRTNLGAPLDILANIL